MTASTSTTAASEEAASAVATSTAASKFTVSIILEPAVHEFYAEQAAKDERTLNKYLARLIKKDYDLAQIKIAARSGSGTATTE